MENRTFTYGSVTLRPSDMRLFGDGRWLNDNCLCFYIEHLARTVVSSKYLFLEPGTAFLIAMEEDLDDLRASLHRLDLAAPNYFLLPINDNTDPELAAGGSHWTLLVFSKRSGVAYHFNSTGSGGGNSFQAQQVAARLQSLFGVARKQIREIRVQPAQNNGFDCGVYVLAIGETLVRGIIGGVEEAELMPKIFTKVNPEDVTAKRREIARLLADLNR